MPVTYSVTNLRDGSVVATVQTPDYMGYLLQDGIFSATGSTVTACNISYGPGVPAPGCDQINFTTYSPISTPMITVTILTGSNPFNRQYYGEWRFPFADLNQTGRYVSDFGSSSLLVVDLGANTFASEPTSLAMLVAAGLLLVFMGFLNRTLSAIGKPQ